MSHITLDRYIEVHPGIMGGKPHISGHRISVQDVVILHDRLGLSVDEIADAHGLSLAEIYAALAYYYDHPSEIEKTIADDEQFVKNLRQTITSKVNSKIKGE